MTSFSEDSLKIITSNKFADAADFLAIEAEKFDMFEVPAESVLVLTSSDTPATIRTKFLNVENRHHIWIDGCLNPGKHTSSKVPILNNIEEVVQGLKREDLMPEEFSLHYRRTDKFSPLHVHPFYLREVLNGKVEFPIMPFPMYKGGQPMVEITVVYKGDNLPSFYGMAFELSNFHPVTGGVMLADEFGIEIDPKSWKNPLTTMHFNTMEQLIQGFKVAASCGKTYKLKTLEAITKSLNPKRIADLKKTFDIDASGEPSFELNDAINAKLMEIMQTESDPKKQKACGRLCTIDGELYFPQMNKTGNALIMAVSVLIRLYKEVPAVVELVDFCVRHNFLVHEAAMHDGNDDFHGGFKDMRWGERPCQPRFSHKFLCVLAKETADDAFGKGTNAVIAALRGCRKAKGFLGLDATNDDPIIVNKETVAKVIMTMFTEIKE
jgi:hypothetical protein